MNSGDNVKRKRLGILGSGSGSNMQAILDAIRTGRLDAEIACVISDVEGAFILERAGNAGIPAYCISAGSSRTRLDGEGEALYLDKLNRHGVDLVVLAGFMRIIKSGMLDAYGGRIINIHPSLLPSFPGLEAWKQALEYGVKITGCTVHFVDAGTDTGPVIVQRSVMVRDDDTSESLHARIQVEEHKAYPEALGMLCGGNAVLKGRRVCQAASDVRAGSSN